MSFEPICITPVAEIDASELITTRIPDFLQKASQPDTSPLQKKGALRIAAGAALSGLKGLGKFAFRSVANPYAATVLSMTGAFGLATAAIYPNMMANFGARSGWSTSVNFAVTNGTTGEEQECATTPGAHYANNYDAAAACADYIKGVNFPIGKLQMSYSLADKNIRGMTNLGDTHGHYGDPYDGGSRTFTDISRNDALREIESFQMAALENDGKIILQPNRLDYWRYQAYVRIPKAVSSSVTSLEDRVSYRIEGMRDKVAGWLEGIAGSVRTPHEENVGTVIEISDESPAATPFTNAPH
ncbi:MAG: hypothetical protein AB7E85_04635 [Pseudobdellovibrionaceae bacterium]